ncbi:MAG: hypothetical protein KJ057_08260 [Phycisphaerae bacterium]|nr:MAG: hypothetical protein EDS66_05140 [Planctomycetota bacterium]KAB2947431.1 MAG: hypothetical protein F9K17_07450 [Phycisphaerae bacterium]MBE7456331.1 hypothetical protein [Planctomycetia bacterium]MCK6465661.1 hypothetical protein [Phycisphaerae bacterium]MCL4718450.1 hypothetical protein [Phycisphaerae bacterium]
MPADLLVTAVAVMAGLGALIYGVFWALSQALRAMSRGVMWMFDVDDNDEAAPRIAVLSRCRNPACGHEDARPARYCPKCGGRI